MATFPFPGAALIKFAKVEKLPSVLIIGSRRGSQPFLGPRHLPVASLIQGSRVNAPQEQFSLFESNGEESRGSAEARVLAQTVPGIFIPYIGSCAQVTPKS